MISFIRSVFKVKGQSIESQGDLNHSFAVYRPGAWPEGDESGPDFEIPWLSWQMITLYPISPIMYLM